MFRKKKVATPGFGHTPWNPIHGQQANLRQDGTAPYCAMMQVAAEDTYDNYVICRGFDTRILRFIDYAQGNANKPGISVAKPFGKRRTGTYSIGEVYPALLPTQGNALFTDFHQVTFVPPSPSTVNWRIGQTPGVVVGGQPGGQPNSLSDPINILYDHNNKVVNWLLLDSSSDFKSDEHFQYQLITNWFGGIALAIRKNMDGVALSNPSLVIVRDPLAIFSYQHAGDRGYMVYKPDLDKFYAIQAPCDSSSTGPTNPGACCYYSGSSWDCFNASEADCLAFGGYWGGEGTLCEAVECSDIVPKGACLDGLGGCWIVSQAECNAQGRIYMGDGTSC